MLQYEKANYFRDQHNSPKLLMLPNVWDVMSAKLMESVGFHSLATASVALAAANGYPDDQHIPLELLLQQVSKIVRSVSVPVSVDFERGYSNNLSELQDNVKRLMDTGAIGINIEDSEAGGKGLKSIAEQCKILEMIRKVANDQGINLVINARTDVYLNRQIKQPVAEAIKRAKAYGDAGADCFYPILISRMDELETLVKETSIPINVLMIKPFANLLQLEQLGIKRVSLGPGMLNYAITKMQNVAKALREYDTKGYFDEESVNTAFLNQLI
ncbi:isocitrate lyase/phosphoenolpyruvate mutase family protein [Pedobacter ginsengiterrae]|uniref:Isocitrate lyase/phosphoenolpyruvate mutase family protein n=1 Tax=Pedobacter ginsengiterrae TaxID=871696 RepID=A0ABP7P2D1_9SPHI